MRYYNAGPNAIAHEEFLPAAPEPGDQIEATCNGKCGHNDDGKMVYIHSFCAALGDRAKMLSDMKRAHPLGSPAKSSLVFKDGKTYIKRPANFCPRDREGNAIPQLHEWVPGSVMIGIHEQGFRVIPPNESTDIDDNIPVESVKAMAPHLLTQDEWDARKSTKKPADKAQAQR